MAFDIRKYLEENTIEMGSIKKEVGTSISKSGHNDLRKTNYDVKIVDGKLDLNTHKSIMSEAKNPIKSSNRVKPSAFKHLMIVTIDDTEHMEVAKFREMGDAITAREAFNKNATKGMKYSIVDA